MLKGKPRNKKVAYYLGELVRFYCPGLYGKPIYDDKGHVIPYVITIPKIGELKELC